MFRKREGTTDSGVHWENMDEIYYLKRILETQKEIVKKLEGIDNNIIKYFGNENDLKEKKLLDKISNAGLTNEQLNILKESIEYTKEKYSTQKQNDYSDICSNGKNKHEFVEISPQWCGYRYVCKKCGDLK